MGIKEEILLAVKDQSLSSIVEKEIEIMAINNGADDKPFLNTFYDIWKKKTGKKGSDNRINSWTAYAIGMTSKKPEEGATFLPKRRVLARASFPDIDQDFDNDRRDEIYDYLIEKYGREYVSNIGTYNGLKMRSYIKKAIKSLDPEKSFLKGKKEWREETNQLGNDIVKSLPTQFGAFLKVRDEDGSDHPIKTVEDAHKYCKGFAYYTNKYPDLLKNAKNIEGLLSSNGVHAAGAIISSEPLYKIAPVRQSKKKQAYVEDIEDLEVKYELATQFENADLEYLGLIKFDILGLKTLAMIRRCLEMIKNNYDIVVDIENIDVKDKKAYTIYEAGKLTGIFQMEERGMRSACKQIGCTSLHDIMVIISMYRPGPMEYIPQYAARKHGTEPVTYFDPSVKQFIEIHTKETFGLLVYQEQIQRICNTLSGFSVAEGYVIIKAIGKKKPELMAKYKDRFVSGAEKNGVPKNVSTTYWDQVIVPFAGYSFNKAHACCYGYMSYITAYLKAHFPEEFAVSYLNAEIPKYERIADLERMAVNELDMIILPRHINKCKVQYEVHKKGGNGIKTEIMPSIMCLGLSLAAAENIVANQPYESLKDFAEKTDSTIVDRGSVLSLLDAGFFRPATGKRRPADDILAEFETVRADLKKFKRKGIESVNLFA